jgi:hypothetical protein
MKRTIVFFLKYHILSQSYIEIERKLIQNTIDASETHSNKKILNNFQNYYRWGKLWWLLNKTFIFHQDQLPEGYWNWLHKALSLLTHIYLQENINSNQLNVLIWHRINLCVYVHSVFLMLMFIFCYLSASTGTFSFLFMSWRCCKSKTII